MNYETAVKELSSKTKNLSYFNEDVYNIILKDRDKAIEVLTNNQDVSAFYRDSETHKTEFYNKNSPAYCHLLSVLESAKTVFRCTCKGLDKDNFYAFQEYFINADNENQAKCIARFHFENNNPGLKNIIVCVGERNMEIA